MKAVVRHKLQCQDDFGRDAGSPRWENMATLRHYVSKKVEIDKEALALWQANEELHKRMEAEKQVALQVIRDADASAAREQADDDANFARIETLQIEAKRESSTIEGEEVLLSSRMRLLVVAKSCDPHAPRHLSM